MSKADLMANWDTIVTDVHLTLDGVRGHLELVDRDGIQPLEEGYWPFVTGGSSGDPAVVVWSSEEMSRWGASVERWLTLDGAPAPSLLRIN